MNASEPDQPGSRRLKGWKEIAAFIGCDERTAKRWEEVRGMPVRRMQTGPRSGVFAFAAELGTWLDQTAPAHPSRTHGEDSAELRPGVGAGAERKSATEKPHLAVASRYRSLVWLLPILAILVAAAAALALQERGERRGPHEPSAEALAFYNAGYADWQSRTADSLRRAVDEFTQAIVHDPQYAKAYVGLANCYNLLREYTAMPAAYAFPRAKAAAERAIALDPSLSDAHAALAFADFYWSYDSESAAREFQTAIALQPNSVTAHHWYAGFLAMHRDFTKALAEIEKARALDPESRSILSDRALILFDMGQFKESAALLRQQEQTAPGFFSPHQYLLGIDLVNGDYADYLRELSASAETRQDPQTLLMASVGKTAFANGGKDAMFNALLKLQLQLFERGKSDAYSVALLQADVGNFAETIVYLKLALSRHETMGVALNVAPEFQRFRELPAFRELARQAGVSLG